MFPRLRTEPGLCRSGDTACSSRQRIAARLKRLRDGRTSRSTASRSFRQRVTNSPTPPHAGTSRFSSSTDRYGSISGCSSLRWSGDCTNRSSTTRRRAVKTTRSITPSFRCSRNGIGAVPTRTLGAPELFDRVSPNVGSGAGISRQYPNDQQPIHTPVEVP